MRAPDDQSGDGLTWRARVLAYNERPEDNPLGLLSAGQLYAHDAYAALVEKFGVPNVFILSAG